MRRVNAWRRKHLDPQGLGVLDHTPDSELLRLGAAGQLLRGLVYRSHLCRTKGERADFDDGLPCLATVIREPDLQVAPIQCHAVSRLTAPVALRCGERPCIWSEGSGPCSEDGSHGRKAYDVLPHLQDPGTQAEAREEVVTERGGRSEAHTHQGAGRRA